MARGRPPLLHPTREVHVRLDERLMARLDIELFSPAEGRVPKGAQKAVFEALLRGYWDSAKLDLSPYLGTQPGESIIQGSPASISALKSYLERNPR